MLKVQEELLDQALRYEPGELWSSVLQQLMEILVEQTDSQYAVYRTLDEDTGNFVRRCFAPRQRYQQSPPLSEDEFEIPLAKPRDCYGVDDPRNFAAIVNCSTQPIDTAQKKQPGEEAFADWVRHKAWFPIFVHPSQVGIAVLLRGDSLPYQKEDIFSKWLCAQEYMSLALDGVIHEGFRSALQALNSACRALDSGSFWRLICHCLTSQYGLRWNRVWFLEESEANENEFICVGALGEVNKERWLQAVDSMPKEVESLQQEIRACSQDVTDLLSIACIGSEPLTIHLEKSISTDLFGCGVSEQIQSDWRRRLSVNLSMLSSGIEAQFASTVRERVSQLGSVEFVSEQEIHALPIEFAAKRFLVLLQQEYSGESQPNTISSLFLHQVARVYFQWLIDRDSINESDELKFSDTGAEYSFSTEVRQRLEELGVLLS